jgi:hypothetical protein
MTHLRGKGRQVQIAAEHVDVTVQPGPAHAYIRNKKLNAELQAREAARWANGPWLLVCECGRVDCAETLELTNAEYALARSHPRLYVVSPGHGAPGVTSTVSAASHRFELVELLPGAH